MTGYVHFRMGTPAMSKCEKKERRRRGKTGESDQKIKSKPDAVRKATWRGGRDEERSAI